MIEFLLFLLGLYADVQEPSPTPQKPGGSRPSPSKPPSGG